MNEARDMLATRQVEVAALRIILMLVDALNGAYGIQCTLRSVLSRRRHRWFTGYSLPDLIMIYGQCDPQGEHLLHFGGNLFAATGMHLFIFISYFTLLTFAINNDLLHRHLDNEAHLILMPMYMASACHEDLLKYIKYKLDRGHIVKAARCMYVTRESEKRHCGLPLCIRRGSEWRALDTVYPLWYAPNYVAPYLLWICYQPSGGFM